MRRARAVAHAVVLGIHALEVRASGLRARDVHASDLRARDVNISGGCVLLAGSPEPR